VKSFVWLNVDVQVFGRAGIGEEAFATAIGVFTRQSLATPSPGSRKVRNHYAASFSIEPQMAEETARPFRRFQGNVPLTLPCLLSGGVWDPGRWADVAKDLIGCIRHWVIGRAILFIENNWPRSTCG
jgi:hypothetical protein